MYCFEPDRQSFLLEASAIPPGSTINSVSISTRLSNAWGGSPQVKSFLRLGGANQDGPTNAPSGWQTFIDIITRPGGGPWSLADLATLEVGVLNDAAAFGICTTLFVIVDYTPPAAAPFGAMLLLF
jgi:hypothetical protein